MATWVKKNYEGLFEYGLVKMNLSRGKLQGYLGMTLIFLDPEEVNITINPYIEEMVKYLSNHYENVMTYTTPASDPLFKTIEYAIFREETQSNSYHNFFAKVKF